MSKKNCYHKTFIKNKYPLEDNHNKGCVVYSTKINGHKMNLVPIKGKEYHAYDDGKITFSRHYIVNVSNVYNHMYFRKHFKDIYDIWVKDKKNHYWIFKDTTDYFVETTNPYDNFDKEYFARTHQGGWFSIGYPDCMVGSRLDITGNISKNLIKYIDEYNYSEEEKKEILETFNLIN